MSDLQFEILIGVVAALVICGLALSAGILIADIFGFYRRKLMGRGVPRVHPCGVIIEADTSWCPQCGAIWDTNDSAPPACRYIGE